MCKKKGTFRASAIPSYPKQKYHSQSNAVHVSNKTLKKQNKTDVSDVSKLKVDIIPLPPGSIYNKCSSISPLISLFIYKYMYFLKQISYTHCSENTMKLLFYMVTCRLTSLFLIAAQSYAFPSMTLKAETRKGMMAGSEARRFGLSTSQLNKLSHLNFCKPQSSSSTQLETAITLS